MNTELGEPEWVNWSKARWDLEEAQASVATTGASIQADLERLSESIPSHEEDWHQHYDKQGEIETFHHDILGLIERAKYIGILRTR